MNRRDVLKAAGAGLGLAAAPAWIREAFAARPQCLPVERRIALLAAAWKSAREQGKPLLVFVAPADEGERYRRGAAFGELLNHGGDPALALLAWCEVAAGHATEIAKVLPSASTDGAPLMLLAEPDGSTVHALSTALPQSPQLPRGADGQALEAQITARIKALEAMVRGAVAPDEPTRKRRADTCWATLSDAEQQKLQVGGDLPLDLVDRAAAVVNARRGPAALAALANAARARLVRKAVPGAMWATNWGCGEDIELPVPVPSMVDCGMGHVPQRSARFVKWYTCSE